MQRWEAIGALLKLDKPASVMVVGTYEPRIERALADALPEATITFTGQAPGKYQADPDLLRPPHDEHCRLVEDEVMDLDLVLPWLAHRRTCIQAGGCYGVWPRRLAQHFEAVYTFEPEPGNFRLLVANCAHLDNVICLEAALGHHSECVRIEYGPGYERNAGAGYTVEGGIVPRLVIDDMLLSDVDLIWLDVEGDEPEVLEGAEATIDQWQPVVVLEAKALPHRDRDPFTAIRWLEGRGYRRQLALHRDVLMLPKGASSHESHRLWPPESFAAVILTASVGEGLVAEQISEWYPALAPGGRLIGLGWGHKPPDVANAVAAHFDLMQVTNLPDSVWTTRKLPASR